MGFKGSKVQILSSRPEITRGYGENRNPFVFASPFLCHLCARFFSEGGREFVDDCEFCPFNCTQNSPFPCSPAMAYSSRHLAASLAGTRA